VAEKALFIRNILIKALLFICALTNSGCSALFGPLPPATGTICHLPSNSEANPYQNAVELAATQMPTQMPDVSSTYIYSILDNTGARQRALSQLTRNTEHLSDQVNVATNDTNMVRIVVTYLDPELIQYIILNQFLNDPEQVNDKNIENFNDDLNQIMKKLGERNEILFLVTITSPFYVEQAYNSNVLIVNIPITEMTLINGSGRRVKPHHSDYILNSSIDITHGPVSGIVGYPVAVIDQGQCMPTIDKWTNSLTLELSKIELGGNEISTQVWSIPYRSLLMTDNSYPTPTFDPMMGTPISRLEAPPTPHWIPNAKEDSTDPLLYWTEMGRYIWNYVINESHH